HQGSPDLRRGGDQQGAADRAVPEGRRDRLTERGDNALSEREARPEGPAAHRRWVAGTAASAARHHRLPAHGGSALRGAPEVDPLIRSVNSTFENYVKLNKKIPPEMIMSVASIDDAARLSDTIVAHLGIKLEDKQTLLEMINPGERLEKVLGFMRSEIEILEVEKRIRTRVKKQMEKTQKEYYLNEQMRAIQKELGEKDEF